MIPAEPAKPGFLYTAQSRQMPCTSQPWARAFKGLPGTGRCFRSDCWAIRNNADGVRPDLRTEARAKLDACLRPVAQRAAYYPGQARARLHLRRIDVLECDLDPIVDFQQPVGGKQQPRLAHINRFAGRPVFLAFQPVAQGDMQFMA